jgi:hypothetical protein
MGLPGPLWTHQSACDCAGPARVLTGLPSVSRSPWLRTRADKESGAETTRPGRHGGEDLGVALPGRTVRPHGGCLTSARYGRDGPDALRGGHRIPVMRVHLATINPCLMDLAPALYTIRVSGHLGATMLSAFPAMAPQQHGTCTVLTGLLDRSALYGVLTEIEALGLDLVEVRRLTPERGSPPPGDLRSP